MRAAGILIFILAITRISTAQNLVPNSSFEEYSKCPLGFSTKPSDFAAMHWLSASTGTPDYYNKCSIGENDVPANWAGVSHTHSGAGYAGIYAWSFSSGYREYVQCELMEPLQAGVTYKVSFYYRISSYSVYAIDRIGILFSDSLFNQNHDQRIMTEPTFQQVKSFSELSNGWQLASFDLKAKGGERFLTIGNFARNEETKYMKIDFRLGKSSMLGGSSYYYLDDVSVESYQAMEEDEFELLTYEDEIKPEEVYVLKNIHFEFNSYRLLPTSFKELDELVKIMKKNPTWTVELTGHTDDVGSESYNLQLSRSRAKSVGEYLSTNGVDKMRIFTQGFGKEKPLVPATDEEARKKNRRVELRFLN